jgi:DNA-binding NarL/FixJ family response regulator
MNQNEKLTKREEEILKGIYEEQSTPEIAEELQISKNTVEFHRKNLMSKIGAKNVIGLIKYYFSRFPPSSQKNNNNNS